MPAGRGRLGRGSDPGPPAQGATRTGGTRTPVSYTHLDVYKRQAIGSLLAVTLYGVFGYLALGYTPLDAMYQSVMTLTTCLLYTSRCV